MTAAVIWILWITNLTARPWEYNALGAYKLQISCEQEVRRRYAGFAKQKQEGGKEDPLLVCLPDTINPRCGQGK